MRVLGCVAWVSGCLGCVMCEARCSVILGALGVADSRSRDFKVSVLRYFGSSSFRDFDDVVFRYFDPPKMRGCEIAVRAFPAFAILRSRRFDIPRRLYVVISAFRRSDISIFQDFDALCFEISISRRLGISRFRARGVRDSDVATP